MKINFLLFLITLNLLFSCNLFFDKEEEKDNKNRYPIFNAKVSWRSDTKFNSHFYGVQNGKHLYSYENISVIAEFQYDLKKSLFRVMKLDIETGNVLWRSDNLPKTANCSPVLSDNKLFLLVDDDLLYCLDADNGNILTVIKINDNFSNHRIEQNLISHNNFIYFGFSYRNIYLDRRITGISRIDINNLVYDNITEPQTIEPEMFWESKYNSRVMSLPVFKDNIMYFMTYTDGILNIANRDKTLEFAAINTDNKEILWYKEIFDDDGSGHLLINDNIIYMMNTNVSAFNLTDGERIYIKSASGFSPMRALGSVFYNNKLYYTNGNFSVRGEGKNPNVVSLNADDGSLAWGWLDYDCFSLGVVPLITNDKVYLPLEYGFTVLNAHTGKVLGVDRNFYGQGIFGVIFQYNNLLIYPNRNKDGYSNYIAIDISE